METTASLSRLSRKDVCASFPVHDVAPETPNAPKISMNDSLKACMISGEDFLPEIVAVSDIERHFVKLPSQNAFLSAVHLAFSGHRPLTLSPDIIWLAILQGFGRHIKAHASQLETRLMLDSGKHIIQLDLRSSTWDWAMVFDQFAIALESHAGPWIRKLQADFSTTGKIERTASHVALMDLFSPYVQFIARCICGIPSIKLQGCPSDWGRMREKLALLRGYDADDWIQELDEILARFVDASDGRVDRAWWQQIYKLTPKYGGEDIEGWVAAFFPYLKDERGKFERRRIKDETFTTEIVPPGLSDVAVKLQTQTGSDSLRAISGFTGVADLGAEGVMPKIGWAVVRNHFMESFVASLELNPGIRKRPVPGTPPARTWWNDFESLPVDLQLFYTATDGADLFGSGTIHPVSILLKTGGAGLGWTHLGAWNDGSLLLTNGPVVRLRWTGDTWESQTLGTTFSDFIARLVAADGQAYWEGDDFVEPEITPRWREFSRPSPSAENPSASLRTLQQQNGRLRWLKLIQHDVFAIYPPSGKYPWHLPPALQLLYCACDGVVQRDGFEIWPAARVTPVAGSQSRWFEVGAAPGYRILFDAAAERGLAVIATELRSIRQIAGSFADFFTRVKEAPQTLYWDEAPRPMELEFERPSILWPDEKIDLRSVAD